MIASVPNSPLRRGIISVKIILFLLLLILFVAFVNKNMRYVELYYYDYKLQMQSLSVPLFAVIITTFMAGFFSAWFWGYIARMKLKASLRKQTKTIQNMNEELEKIKAAPRRDIVNE